MPTDRCARLTLVSTANDLKEAWISDHPYLAVTYLWQYAPTWAWWLMNRMGKRRIQNFKSGVVSLFALLRLLLTLLTGSLATGMPGWHFGSISFLPPHVSSGRCQARLQRRVPRGAELLQRGHSTLGRRTWPDLQHMGCRPPP